MAGLTIKIGGTQRPVRSPATVITVRDVGEVSFWPTAVVPNGWLKCDGSAVSRTTYSELFAVIGTTFGVGDGSTTFNLPPANGRVLVGQDGAQVEFDTIGEKGGAKTVTLTALQSGLRAHEHHRAFYNSGGAGTAAYLGAAGATNWQIAPDGNTGVYGGAQPAQDAHENMPPYLTLVPMIRAVAQAVKPNTGQIINNPRFEEVDGSGFPLGWEAHNGGGTLSTDTSVKWDGTRSAKVVNSGSFLDVRSSLFKVAGGQMITLRLKGRAATASTVVWSPGIMTAPGDTEPTVATSGVGGVTKGQAAPPTLIPATWTERTWTFIVPAGHETACVLLSTTSSGTAYYDDVEVTIGVPTTPVVVEREPVVVAATTGNITLSNAQTVDGYTPTTGDLILVWRQTVLAENGIYVYNSAVGQGGLWQRASGFDTGKGLAGRVFTVLNGTQWGGWRFKCDQAATVVPGVNNLTFTRQHAGRVLLTKFNNGNGPDITNSGAQLTYMGDWKPGVPPTDAVTARVQITCNGRSPGNAAGYWYLYVSKTGANGYVLMHQVRFHNNADPYKNFSYPLIYEHDVMPGEDWWYAVNASMDAGGTAMFGAYFSGTLEYRGGK